MQRFAIRLSHIIVSHATLLLTSRQQCSGQQQYQPSYFHLVLNFELSPASLSIVNTPHKLSKSNYPGRMVTISMLLWYGLLHARNSLLRFGTWLPARNRDRAKIVPIPIWRLDPNYWSDPEEPRNENSLAGRKWLFKFMARKKICCTELRKRKHIKNGNTTVIISVHTQLVLYVYYMFNAWLQLQLLLSQ